MKNKRVNSFGCTFTSLRSCLNTQLFSLVKNYSLLLFVLLLSVVMNAQVTPDDGEDKITRKLLSITRHDPTVENTNADVLIFRATFEVDVQNVDATDFEIDGTTSASITNVVAVEGTSVYELTVSGGDLADFNGSVGLNLNPAHDILHANRYNVSTEEPAIDESYLVDNTINGSVSVVTTVASGITYNSALSGGEVTIEGEVTVLSRGVCWSTNPNPTIYSNITSDGSGDGSFASSISDLTPGNTYYYKAYATASAGTVYGEEYSFTTPCLNPVAANAITGNTEICPGGSTDLTVQGGLLNNATDWRWYSESCGGTFFGSGTTITVSPSESTTYYVRAEGDCVTPSACVSITVNVREIGNPVVTCPTDIIVNNDLENCSAVVNEISPLSVNNNCGDQTISYTVEGATTGNGVNDASGISFNPGLSTVEYIASNGNGNLASCSFTVTVIDAEKPLISCPENVSISDVGENCSVAVSDIAPISVSDNCEGTTLSYSFLGATTGNGINDASGNFFNVGLTVVEYLVIDGSGNTGSCSFEVSVIGNDTQNPTISCPGDITVNSDVGICSAVVSGIAPVSMDDNCGIQTVTYTLSGATTGEGYFDASGNAFNIGETIVQYTVVDGSSNSASCSFTVTVNDIENPTIACPTDTITVNDAGSCSAVVNGIAPVMVNDNCSTPLVAYTLSGATTGSGINDASGTSFNLGVTIVEYTVTDGAGNQASSSFTVTVDDNEAPVVVCPANVTVSSENDACTAVVNNLAPNSVSDNCGTPTVTYTLLGETEGSGGSDASGTVFNVGETTVTYTATDGYGNSSSSSFIVKVIESVKPVAITQDITVAINNSGFAEIAAEEVNNNSTDNCGLDTMYLDRTYFGCKSLGENEVTLTVVDKAGNTDTERAIVTVIDTLPPVFDYYPDIYVLADKDESTVIVNYNDPEAWDNCAAKVTQIGGLPSGEAFSAGANLITYLAVDSSGNSSEMSFLIYVIPYSELALRVPTFKYCFNSVDSLRLPGKVLEMDAEWFYDREITEPIELSESNKMEAPQVSTTIYALLKGFYNVPKVIVPISVTVYPLPKIDAGDDVTIFQGTKLQLNATYDTTYTYLWTVSDSSETTRVNDLLDNATITKLLLSNDTIYNPVFDGKVIDKYELRVQVWDGHFCENSDTIIVEVGGLKAYSGFTPNNDGFNDYWVVKNIELYPDNLVRIFDRNNVLVYQKRGYDNSWQGTFDTRTKQKLPSGTYFYIIELSGGEQVYKGVVTILTND